MSHEVWIHPLQLPSLNLREIHRIALDALIKCLYGHDYTECERFHAEILHIHTFQGNFDIYFLAIEHEFPGLQLLAAQSARTRLDCLTEPRICAEAPAIFETIKTVLYVIGDGDKLFQARWKFFMHRMRSWTTSMLI